MKPVVMKRKARTSEDAQPYVGRMALCSGGRCMVLDRNGSVLYHGSENLWRMLVARGMASGGGL